MPSRHAAATALPALSHLAPLACSGLVALALGIAGCSEQPAPSANPAPSTSAAAPAPTPRPAPTMRSDVSASDVGPIPAAIDPSAAAPAPTGAPGAAAQAPSAKASATGKTAPADAVVPRMTQSPGPTAPRAPAPDR